MRLIDPIRLKMEICMNNILERGKTLEEIIDDTPEADAAPVVHGRWVDKKWDGDFLWRIDGRGNCWRVISCSVCGENLCGSANTAYCPHCGAKMDLPEGGE